MFRRLSAFTALVFCCAWGPPGVDAEVNAWGRLPLSGGYATKLIFSPADPSVAYALLEAGVVARSDDAGKTWSEVSRTLYEDGGLLSSSVSQVADVAVDPLDRGGLYVAVYGRGVLHGVLGDGGLGDDGEASWTTVNEGIEGESALWLYTDPYQPDRMFVGMIDNLYRRQGGSTWQPVLGLDGARPLKLAVDPSSPQTLYLSVFKDGAHYLMRSTDGGASWLRLAELVDELQSLEVDPASSLNLWGVHADRVIRSADGGHTWSPVDIDGELPLSLTLRQEEQAVNTAVYLLTQRKLLRSRNLGQSWSDMGLNSWRDLVFPRAFAFAPSGSVFLTAVQGTLLRSEDEGFQWQPAVDGLPGGFVADVSVAPTDPDVLYAVTALGLMASENDGAGWELRHVPFSGFGMDVTVLPTSPRHLVMGALGSVNRSVDGGRTWSQVLSGSGFAYVAVDPRDSNTLFAAFAGGSLHRTRGSGWQEVWTLRDRGSFLGVWIAPSDASTVYAASFHPSDGESSLLRSVDGGDTWTTFRVMEGRLAALAVDPENSRRLVAGAFNGGLSRSPDGGETWAELSFLADGIEDIQFDPKDGSTLFVTQWNEGGVWRSTDGGDSFRALPDLTRRRVNAQNVTVDPSEPSTIYAGTREHGLFRIRDVERRKTLWLRDGRFKAEITWQDEAGTTGEANVSWLPEPVADVAEAGEGAEGFLASDQSTVLSFFSPDNWEVLLKVLDGRTINDHHWLFLAAATDVGYRASILDTACGTERVIEHGSGSPAPVLNDVEAFPMCDDPAPPSCVASPGVACLGDGRFQVEMDWLLGDAEGSALQVEPAAPGLAKSRDAGVFSFFSNENWDLVVKVLDGCALNDRFWVFSVATTDVEFTLTVTDTKTGQTWSRTNPQGQIAPAWTDLEAFATCDS